MNANRYVLISACRNEEAYIDDLIDTVSNQTVPPIAWIIVDDGSTDATSKRIEKRRAALPWLRLERMPGGRQRSFASQAYAAQYGYDLARNLEFDFTGFLDADIRLDPTYYAELISRFGADAKLGLAGGMVLDKLPGALGSIRLGSEEYHVAGGVQFFRRECFEQIGGYVPVEGGGQDTIADIAAMMHGWKIQSFRDLVALHLRPEGVAKLGVFERGLKWGKRFYQVGYHPLFYLGQCVRRVGQPPLVVGSLSQLFGFAVAYLKRGPRPVSPEFVKFLRKLQVERMRAVLRMPR